jgi:NADH-quinone oxidoreductase subunit K
MANVQKFNFCNSRFKSSSNFFLNLNKFYVLKAMIIDQTKYLCVTFILFLIGLSGIFLNRKNIIIMLMSIELMLLAINFNLIVFSVFLDDIVGQLLALLILTVAAAESAIGLAILVIYYRIRGSIAIELINLMKG